MWLKFWTTWWYFLCIFKVLLPKYAEILFLFPCLNAVKIEIYNIYSFVHSFFSSILCLCDSVTLYVAVIHSFSLLYRTALYDYNQVCLYSHSTCDRYLNYFQFVDMTSNAAVNLLVHASRGTRAFILRLLGHRRALPSDLIDNTKVFPKCASL